jgi:hypothetical protein
MRRSHRRHPRRRRAEAKVNSRAIMEVFDLTHSLIASAAMARYNNVNKRARSSQCLPIP